MENSSCMKCVYTHVFRNTQYKMNHYRIKFSNQTKQNHIGVATQVDSISYIDDDFDVWKYDLTQKAFIVDGSKMHFIYGITEIIF